MRAKVKWPCRILRRIFGLPKSVYRGLKKDHERLLAAFELVNLYQHRKRLAPPRAKCLCRPEIGLQRQNLPVNIAHSAASCTAVSTKLLTQFFEVKNYDLCRSSLGNRHRNRACWNTFHPRRVDAFYDVIVGCPFQDCVVDVRRESIDRRVQKGVS